MNDDTAVGILGQARLFYAELKIHGIHNKFIEFSWGVQTIVLHPNVVLEVPLYDVGLLVKPDKYWIYLLNHQERIFHVQASHHCFIVGFILQISRNLLKPEIMELQQVACMCTCSWAERVWSFVPIGNRSGNKTRSSHPTFATTTWKGFQAPITDELCCKLAWRFPTMLLLRD